MPTILTKKSDTPGAIPATANLTNAAGGAELAVNTADKRLFTITSGSQVVELGTNPASLTCADVSATVLRAGSATITNLIATTATVSDLSATVARISSLTISSLSLSNATFGSATITNLTSTSATISSALTLTGGTANGVLYLNGSKVATSGSNITFDGTDLRMPNGGSMLVGASASGGSILLINGTAAAQRLVLGTSGTDAIINATRTSGTSPNLLFQIESTEGMRLTSTGLGIGTSSPATKLDVNGDVTQRNGSGTIIGNIQNSSGWYDFKASANVNGAQISTAAATPIRFLPNGVEAARFDSSGNLGIGTSSPSVKLQVNTGTNGTAFTAEAPSATNSQVNIGIGVLSAGRPFVGTNTDSNEFEVGTRANTSMLFVTNSAERMRLDSSGNVGIGTSSPGAKLQVSATSPTNGITSIFTGSGSTGVQLQLTQGGVDDWAFGQPAGVSAFAIWSGRAVGSGGTERLRIDSSGNLGLGVTPSAWTVGSAFQLGYAGSVWYDSTSALGNTRISNNIQFNSALQYLQTGAASYYQQGNGAHYWFSYASGSAGAALSGGAGQAMTLDASGNLGVGATAPLTALSAGSKAITVAATASNRIAFVELNGWRSSSGDQSTGVRFFNNSGATPFAEISGLYGSSNTSGDLAFFTANTERARITSGGDFGIGTASPSTKLEVAGNVKITGTNLSIVPSTGTNAAYLVNTNTSGNLFCAIDSSTGSAFGAGNYARVLYSSGAYPLAFFTNDAERARITAAGEFVVGATTPYTANTFNAVGGFFSVRRSGNTPAEIRRDTDDGTLIDFQQEGVSEGSISVSGNTVSYNAFAGSHWSQLQDGSKPDILRGTVMESINELCVWPGEQNERLPKAKISDTAGSKKVYGVFMAWDNDWTTTNDMYVTAVGAFICRVNGSVTVQEGDLLESNGDGTARVQADDIIRSSTIGKVTSTVKTHQYADGSYCVPTVLYCG